MCPNRPIVRNVTKSIFVDINVVSNICNLYDADGLYLIDSAQHSPLIGYAYDGFPIYGAYGHKNTDGTGGIVRIKSGHSLRNITVRTHHADGTDVDDGPPVDATYPLGYFREDYEFIANTDPDYLDEHNGRFCKTPEYPNGTYAYFATVDTDWNSAYPYVVGPTFYGNFVKREVNTVNENTTTYFATSLSKTEFDNLNLSIFPNPANDLVAIQFSGVIEDNLQVQLFDITGKLVKSSSINKGSTIAYFDVQTLYNGTYIIKITNGKNSTTRRIVIAK